MTRAPAPGGACRASHRGPHRDSALPRRTQPQGRRRGGPTAGSRPMRRPWRTRPDGDRGRHLRPRPRHRPDLAASPSDLLFELSATRFNTRILPRFHDRYQATRLLIRYSFLAHRSDISDLSNLEERVIRAVRVLSQDSLPGATL